MALRNVKTPKDVSRMIFRHRKLFFFSSVTTMITIMIATRWFPHQYKSTASFERDISPTLNNTGLSGVISSHMHRIELQRRGAIMGDDAIRTLIADPKLFKNTDEENARGLPRLPQLDYLIDRVDNKLTDTGKLEMQTLIKKIQSQISISKVIGRGRGVQPNIKVNISYVSPERRRVPKIADYLVENYITNVKNQVIESTGGIKKSLKIEIASLNIRSAKERQALEQFNFDHPDFKGVDYTTYKNNIKKLEEDRLENLAEIATSKVAASEKKLYLKSLPKYVQGIRLIDNPDKQELLRQISKLNDNLTDQRSLGRKNTHPAVKKTLANIIQLKDKVRDIPDKVEEKTAKTPNPEIHEIEKEITQIEADVKILQAKNESIKIKRTENVRLDGLFESDRKAFKKYTDDLAKTTHSLKKKMEFLDQTELSYQNIDTGVTWRQSASANSPAPLSKPYLLFYIAASIIGGLGIGAGLIIICELLDRTLSTHEQAVDELKLPILGTISEIVSPGEAFRRKILHRGIYPVLGLLAGVIFLSIMFITHISLDKPDDLPKLTANPIGYLSNAVFPKGKE